MQMESLVSGPAGAGAPAGQHPALSRRGGVVRLRLYHQPLVSPDVPPDRHAAGFPTLKDVRRCRASAGAAGVSGGLVSTFSPLYTDLGGTHLDGDRLLQLCLLLHGEHTLPSWMIYSIRKQLFIFALP